MELLLGISAFLDNVGKTTQYAGALALLIIGFAVAMKAGKWWGWGIAAAGGYWAFILTKDFL